MKKFFRKLGWLLGIGALLLSSLIGFLFSSHGATDQLTLSLDATVKSPGKTIVLPTLDTLCLGEVLQVTVYADSNFPVYSNFTMLYYDSRYFSLCDDSGNVLPQSVRGKIPEDFALFTPGASSFPGEVFVNGNTQDVQDFPAVWKNADGSLKADKQNLTVIALKRPYDQKNKPAVSRMSGPLLSFNLKAKQVTPNGAAAATVMLSPDALRTPQARNAPMYYSVQKGSESDHRTSVSMETPVRLLSIETAETNPRTWKFTPSANGSLNEEITTIRNIPAGRSIAKQKTIKFPTVRADAGYVFSGWAKAGSTTLLRETDPIQEDITLQPVFQKSSSGGGSSGGGGGSSGGGGGSGGGSGTTDPGTDAAPVISGQREIIVHPKQSTTLAVKNPSGVYTWSSSNSKAILITNTGKLTGQKPGAAVLTVTDTAGRQDSISAQVQYAWWQWFLLIFLFGWIWY